MSGEDLSQAIDAGRVLSALRAAEVVGPELRSLALDRAWPWGEEGLCALYVDRRELPGRREWTVLKAPGAVLPRRLRQAAKRGGLRRLRSLGAWVLPPAGDPELPIIELLDGDLASLRLRRWIGGSGPSRRLRVRLRGYKPLRRLTVEYRLEDGDAADRRLFAKALRARDLSRVEATWAALAGSPAADGLALPRVVVRRWSMALFDPREGTGLDRLVPGPAALRGVVVAGEALAALHGSGVSLPSSHPRRREIETLDRWLTCARRACPVMAGRLAEARRRLARVAGSPTIAPAGGRSSKQSGASTLSTRQP